ncbi:nitrilase/cyanide hydratase and apolipoprotein N-acyltransferase domain containing protein [Pseudohyphozyma bogoriensis]|nr:nitrilase/cyanide hydratase and apolipoprotein N-acyltransferase domain containing protein [Pseudohyphozyma bogoriensis]
MAPSRPLRVALCQFDSAQPADYATPEEASKINLERAHEFVKQAADGKANLVVFPEYFLSGIMADPQHWGLAQHEHKVGAATHETAVHWLESFRLLAVKHDIDIVVGTIVEKSTKVVDGEETEVRSNVAHYVSRKGEILGSYKKANLWHPEKEYLTRGDEGHKVFDTEYGKVGMLVCWDLSWSEPFRELLLQGVEVIIAPTCWYGNDGGDLALSHNPECEKVYLDGLLVTRAFENGVVVMFANVGGKREAGCIGNSGITMPFKGFVAKAKGNEEELIFADIDLGILEDAEKVYGVRKDLLKNHERAGTLPAYATLRV